TEKREFKTLIDESVVYIGYEFYTYEHHLKMQDPNNSEIFFLAMDPKGDEELRFTIINRENIPKGHFLERYANWEKAEMIYNTAVRQRDIQNKDNALKI
ncbi:MAG: hypothetical protein GY774_41155, partial [Planctomycetes bacterium]|nr:hypothetical protein [Planctomycetota bacterium]